VRATASTEAKRELALELGADAAVDVTCEDLADALVEANGGRRVDAVYGLSEVARAHEDLQARRTTGKLLVDPAS